MNEEERSNLYIYTYSDLDDDFIFAETKYTLEDLHKLQQENQQLKEQLEKYQIQNFNLREDKIIKKMSFPNEEIKDKSLLELYSMPSYEDLKEQLQQKEDIINKAIKKCNKEKGRTDFDIFINLNEQLKTLEGFAKKIDYNLHPIITEAYKCDIRNSIDDLCKTLRYDVVYKDSIKEILDNKGE